MEQVIRLVVCERAPGSFRCAACYGDAGIPAPDGRTRLRSAIAMDGNGPGTGRPVRVCPFHESEKEILFQADHRPDPPTSQWKGEALTTGRGTVPDSCNPGDVFTLVAGLWKPGDTRRFIQGSAGRRLGGSGNGAPGWRGRRFRGHFGPCRGGRRSLAGQDESRGYPGGFWRCHYQRVVAACSRNRTRWWWFPCRTSRLLILPWTTVALPFDRTLPRGCL